MPGMQMQVPCVGGQHHAMAAAREVGALKEGTEVELVREPTNQYDSNAVKCIVHSLMNEADATSEVELMIGYVKKNFAADLAHHMDKGMRVKGTVVLLRPNSCMINVEEVVNEKA